MHWDKVILHAILYIGNNQHVLTQKNTKKIYYLQEYYKIVRIVIRLYEAVMKDDTDEHGVIGKSTTEAISE